MLINGRHDRGDVLHGTEASDEIHGYELNDALYGHGGIDWLWGDSGDDGLWAAPAATTSTAVKAPTLHTITALPREFGSAYCSDSGMAARPRATRSSISRTSSARTSMIRWRGITEPTRSVDGVGSIGSIASRMTTTFSLAVAAATPSTAAKAP